MAGETTGERMRAIREARGEKQPEFAAALTAAAKTLRLPLTYEGSKVSRLESGRQPFDLEDVLIVAAVDPQKRGRDWLAWGDSAVSVAEPKPHPPTLAKNFGVALTPPYSEDVQRVSGGQRPGKRGRAP